MSILTMVILAVYSHTLLKIKDMNMTVINNYFFSNSCTEIDIDNSLTYQWEIKNKFIGR